MALGRVNAYSPCSRSRNAWGKTASGSPTARRLVKPSATLRGRAPVPHGKTPASPTSLEVKGGKPAQLLTKTGAAPLLAATGTWAPAHIRWRSGLRRCGYTHPEEYQP